MLEKENCNIYCSDEFSFLFRHAKNPSETSYYGIEGFLSFIKIKHMMYCKYFNNIVAKDIILPLDKPTVFSISVL